MRVSRFICSIVAIFALVGMGSSVAAMVRDNVKNQKECSAMKARHGDGFEPVHIPGSGLSVVIIGDSYTAGYHLRNVTDAWAYKLASLENWDVLIDGVGSTGFIAESPCGQDSFTSRTSTASRAEIVVVQGGLNDFRDELGEVAARAESLVAALPQDARVVVLGPTAAPANPQSQNVDAALRDGLDDTRAEYVSAVNWDLEFLSDGVHLTERGHEAFARNVAVALR